MIGRHPSDGLVGADFGDWIEKLYPFGKVDRSQPLTEKGAISYTTPFTQQSLRKVRTGWIEVSGRMRCPFKSERGHESGC